MDGRCATCRHWWLDDVEGSRIVGVRWDEAVGRYHFTEESYSEAGRPRIAGRRVCHVLGDHAAPLTAVYSYDGTTVETAPDFCCVLWEERPE